MATLPTCSQCGAAIGAADTGGLCTRCLLALGLAEQAVSPPAGNLEAPKPEAWAASPALESGKRLGDYELIEPIARGGMGVVYKARQLSLERVVAVKFLLAGAMAGPAYVRRFRTEASAAASLQHPNIVTIHEVGVHQGQHYLVMDYVDGMSLAQVISNLGADVPDVRRSVRWLKTVAEAVHHAHEHGILHRDLKPSNILIDASSEPRVTDFGLAKHFEDDSELTSSGQVVGSPSYIPPEQAAAGRGKISRRSDVYGLGATLYHLLTGRAPFHAASIADTLDQVLHGQPVAPRTLDPSLPRDLETICLKCLEKEPARRYPTARILAEELDRFLRGEPIQARPVSLPDKVWRWCRRKPLVAGLAAGLVFALLLGFAGVVWQWREADRARRIAEAAQRDSVEKLWGSYLAQARANRWSGRPGRRFGSLDVLSKASAIRPSLELRNEAIACLALPDVQIDKRWKLPPGHGIAFDARLERYARADEEGNVHFHRVRDGTELFQLPGDEIPEDMQFAWSPDGQWLAAKSVYSRSNVFRVWDLAQRQAVITEPLTLHGFPVAFSPDSQTVVAAGIDGGVHLYDLPRGRSWPTLASVRMPVRLDFGPQGARLAICSDRNSQVQILEIASGRVTQRLDHPAGVQGVAWAPDGEVLACACADSRVYLWEVAASRQKAVLEGHTAPATGGAFNHRGDLFVSCGWDGRTRFWDPVTGAALLSISGTPVLPFGPNDDALPFVVIFSDAGIWNVSAARECRRLGPAGVLLGGWFAGHFSPEGRLLAVASSDGVRLWDVETGRQLGVLPVGISFSAVFHPAGDDLWVCTKEHGLQRWPLSFSPQTSAAQLGPPVQLRSPGLGEIAMSRDGHVLAAASPDGPCVLPVKESARFEDFRGHPQTAFVAISPDGAWVASGTWKGQGVQVREVRTGALVAQLPVQRSAMVAFSPDGTWLVTGAPEAYRFWRVGTWSPAGELLRDRAGDFPGSMVFSADGALLALEHGRNLGLKLIDVARQQELASLETGVPLAFSPDGRRLATIGEDRKTLLLWDLRLIRQQLAALNLDWDLPLPQPGPKGEPILELVVHTSPDPTAVALRFESTPRRDPNARPKLIDLSAHYNASPDECWQGRPETRHTGNNLGNLPRGLQQLSSVQFDIRGIVQLSGSELEKLRRDYPPSVSGIQVGQKCRRLHFLHSSGWKETNGTQVGRYVVHYADETTLEIPLKYGQNLREWWGGPVADLPAQTTVAWQGTDAFGKPCRLFKNTWENPRPDEEIRSLDFVSTMTRVAPFLVAITAE